VSLVSLLDHLGDHWLQLGQDVGSDLRLLLHEHLQGAQIFFVPFWEDLVQHQRVVAVEGEDHLAALLIRLALPVDVLNHLAGKRVQHQFVHARANQLAEGFFLGL